ncbi:MAG: glutathione S-transferase family protein [Proteobacteria bacterium]|nr:glutathione S-transferase family protein [Pseudomonadota bacterium]
MLKLHGFPLSNYYNLTRAMLIEKEIDFEEVNDPPSQEDAYLAKSPMGKVPCIETEQGFCSETLAIAAYLEAIKPENSLLPADPFQRAKTIELIRHIELDVELIARRCLPAALFGATASEEVKKSTDKALIKGMKAVKRLMVCKPYAMGGEFTLADLYVFYSFGLAGVITQKMFDRDLLADNPEIATLMTTLAKRPSIAQVEASKQK